MAYNPEHSTLVVLNYDGSGYLRQFDNQVEAKAAYAALSAAGANVYLYNKPTKSISSKPDNAPAPISNTDSQSVENGFPRNPFTFLPSEDATNIKWTFAGCVPHEVRDADNQPQMVPVSKFTATVNGELWEELGQPNTNGCWYPNGFRVSFSNKPSFADIQEDIIQSLDYSGNIFGPYYQVQSHLGITDTYNVANGDGTTREEEVTGIRKISNNQTTWESYQDGDIPYSFSTSFLFMSELVGNPIPNGNFLVTYKVSGDERIHSGYWSASIANAQTKPKVIWKFTPTDPTQPPPEPCTILKKKVNEFSGLVEEVCNDDVVYPFTVTEDCEEPVVVTIEGQQITVGTNTKTGMDNGYGDVTWGPCTGMVYIPNATLIYQTNTLNYFSNGQGGYYVEGGNNCPSQGTILSQTNTDITVNINGSEYTVGYSYERTVADGNCGSGVETGSEYQPYGTSITSDSTYNYYSDGAGGYYTTQVCAGAGTVVSETPNDALVMITEVGTIVTIGTYTTTVYNDGSCGTYSSDTSVTYAESGVQLLVSGGYTFYSDGSGGYYSVACDTEGTLVNETQYDGNIYISETDSMALGGYGSVSTYADGNCGTYTTDNGVTWFAYGTNITSDSNYNYYSNGSGSYYREPINTCPAYGDPLGSTEEYATVNVSEIGMSYPVGTFTVYIYADGSCGSYSEAGGTTWYPYGTPITSDSNNNYYSDGNGSYYSEAIPPEYPPYGTELSSDSGNTTVNVGCGDWVVGYWSCTYYADGSGGSYSQCGGSNVENGTLIGNCNDYNYYADGSGGYYQGEYTGNPCPSYGEPTGQGDSGTNFIEINGQQYENGSYSYTVYNDGNCGTYTSYSYYYKSSGEVIASIITGYDEMNMTDIYTTFYSDGNGGYYT